MTLPPLFANPLSPTRLSQIEIARLLHVDIRQYATCINPRLEAETQRIALAGKQIAQQADAAKQVGTSSITKSAIP